MQDQLPTPPRNPKTDKPVNNYAKYSGVVFKFIGIILISVFAGHFIDGYFKFHFPIFTLSLALLSAFASIYLLVKEIS